MLTQTHKNGEYKNKIEYKRTKEMEKEADEKQNNKNKKKRNNERRNKKTKS